MTGASRAKYQVSSRCRSGADVLCMVLHFGDQLLDGLAAPDLHTTPQRSQIASLVESRITCLEFGEELIGCLIRSSLQTLKHLRPLIHETLRTRTASARFFAYAALLEPADHDTSSTRILTPDFHALHQASYLPCMKASRELNAEFLEQLRGIDVRKSFEAATNQWPNHRQRVKCTRTGFGIDQLRSFWCLLGGDSRRSLRKSLRYGRKRRDVLRTRLCGILRRFAVSEHCA